MVVSPVETRWRGLLLRMLPWVTAGWVFLELLSLRLGLLNAFFFDTAHADVQGIDYFSLPKAWLNLEAGRSLYGTFDPPAYGPHVTWYLAHPLLALVLGWPLSRLAPMDSYGLWTMLSLGVMAVCAWLLARETEDLLARGVIWLLLLGAFPTYLMLWVGNVQALTVLGLTLLFIGMLRVWRGHWWEGRSYIRAGLLLSLFSKPAVALVLPLLLMMWESRKAAVDALAMYLPVSLLCEVVPAVNPERVRLGRVWWLARHPGFVQGNMNVYANGLRLTADMRDNSVHWFNLLAQSGFRLQHVDVFSLPVFLDGLLGVRTPWWMYLAPVSLVLGLSVAVVRVKEEAVRREAAMVLVMAGAVAFFSVYPTVWEYHYTAVLPVAAVLLAMRPGRVLGQRAWHWCLGLACCAWLPSLYVLSGSATPGMGELAMIRLDRVLPVVGLFGVLCWRVGRMCLELGQRVGRGAYVSAA